MRVDHAEAIAAADEHLWPPSVITGPSEAKSHVCLMRADGLCGPEHDSSMVTVLRAWLATWGLHVEHAVIPSSMRRNGTIWQ